MFTGIISNVGNVLSHRQVGEGLVVTFERPAEFTDLEFGESISTNGVCLTVAEIRNDSYDCLLMHETLSASSFGGSMPERVNLERAIGAGQRLGGHFVQGHVDGVGMVTNITNNDGYAVYIEFPRQFLGLVVYKGSITVDGVSLTVARVEKNTLRIALIPFTLEHTTLSDLRTGDKVNLEFDVIGKYVAKLMEVHAHAKS